VVGKSACLLKSSFLVGIPHWAFLYIGIFCWFLQERLIFGSCEIAIMALQNVSKPHALENVGAPGVSRVYRDVKAG
jgi:hypothetical protein